MSDLRRSLDAEIGRAGSERRDPRQRGTVRPRRQLIRSPDVPSSAWHRAAVPRPDDDLMTDAYLTATAFIRGGLEQRHEETARGLAITDADETRRVASAALDLATVLLRSNAECLGLDPFAFLDAFVSALIDRKCDLEGR
jgi:hypothetical protein